MLPALMRHRFLLLQLLVVAFALCGSACNPAIGDGCGSSGDCSVNGERVCDRSQPNGYCTIRGCDPDGCPGSSLCVEWRFEPQRTSETWCMARCKEDQDCRVNSGYRCVSGEDLEDDGVLARVIDLDEKKAGSKFCVSTVE